MGDVRREMKAALKRWRKSGESLREFGRREKLSYHKLVYWRRRLDAAPAAAEAARRRPGQPKPASMLPVHIVPDSIEAPPARFSIRLARDLEIQVSPGFDAAELTRLIRSLLAC